MNRTGDEGTHRRDGRGARDGDTRQWTAGRPPPAAAERPDVADAGSASASAAAHPTDLRRATAWMAIGTAVSRGTGLLRVIALAYALGAFHLADAYNLANTTPNMLYDIVLGGVLSATFIPVFVDRLATRSDREAWRAISSVITLSVVVLVVMTAIFWLLAPQVISAFTVLGHSGHGSGLADEKSVATTLLRWFVPQVALYGILALAEALLNTRRRFVAPMWVPIANNLVCIGVLLWFHALVSTPSAAGALANPGQLLLLGLGTTVGVALQTALLLPHLRGIGLARLRWRWDPRHEAVRTVLRLGSWTFGFVVANQVALYVVLALAVGAPGSDPVSSYTYAYIFMQLPFAVVAVSIMSAVTPDLSERWATGDLAGFRRRLAVGLRATLAVILPAAAGMFLLARPAAALLLAHGSTTVAGTEATGASLAMFSLGLPGFCAFLYVVRVLQSMQRVRVAFWLYLVENGANVVLAAVLVGPLGVRGLALALSIAYSIGAVAGIVVLRRWLGTLGGNRTWSPLRRVGVATAVMGAVVLVVSNISGAEHGLGLFVRVFGSVVVGAAVYAAAATVLGGRARGLALWPELSDPTAPGARRGVSRGVTGATGGAHAGGAHAGGTGPRSSSVRVRAGRGTPGAGAPSDGAPGAVPGEPGGRGDGAPGLGTEEPAAPAARRPSPSGSVRPIGPSVPVARSPRHGEPVPGRGIPGSSIRIVQDPGAARRGRPERDPVDADDLLADDVGEVRWVGGTRTSLPPRPPR